MLTGYVPDDPAHVPERELVVRVSAEDAAPGVEDHQRLRAGAHLRGQVAGGRVREQREQTVELAGVLDQQGLGAREVSRATAFDHVRRERPGASRESDERHATFEIAPNDPDRVHHESQIIFRIRHAQPIDVGRGAHRRAEPGSLSLDELQPETHRPGDGQDVGEEDGGIEREPAQRLQGDLAGELRCAAQRKEAAGARPRRPILREIASGLAHQPDRSAVDRLSRERPQQTVVHRSCLSLRTLAACRIGPGFTDGRNVAGRRPSAPTNG